MSYHPQITALERQLATVTAERDELQRQLNVALKGKRPFSTKLADDVIASQAKRIQELETKLEGWFVERDALKADKERLDWLERTKQPLIPCFGIAPPMGSGAPFPFDGWVLRSDDAAPKPLRAAIDAAREANP